MTAPQNTRERFDKKFKAIVFGDLLQQGDEQKYIDMLSFIESEKSLAVEEAKEALKILHDQVKVGNMTSAEEICESVRDIIFKRFSTPNKTI